MSKRLPFDPKKSDLWQLPKLGRNPLIATEEETNAIENKRRTGLASTGKDFSSPFAKDALSGLLQGDRNNAAKRLAEIKRKMKLKLTGGY